MSKSTISMRTLFILTFLLSFVTIRSQHLLQTSGKVIVNELQDTILLRGMGLGGWMVQEGYMLQTASFANPQHQIRNKIEELIGTSATEAFYDAWLSNHVTRTDIDSLKSWGFNSVRLPMHYNLYTLPIEDEPIAGQNTWLNRGFEMTDSLISWCAQNEMYVVLDLHAAPGGQGYDAGISDYDTSKFSLWESQLNRDKMSSLWKQLAQRYVNEQWVAGYDLLNEPNWNLPGGTALRALYEQVTDSIRSVDTNHILFIEGNWFANDFTGLTPPWDDNMVYSPHKYWSTNDVGSMQFALGLRDAHNVPLYLGESGENSNVWFRNAIKLMEDLGIGWAWWPMKKIDAIAGPLSVQKTPEYTYLLNYWSGSATEPTPEFATDALMDITEGLKIENCIYQKDVIDAMFRQVQSDETLPFKENLQLPGVVYATDFDLGIIGEAYFDNQAANYQVSTGNYTEWNTGWSYRNDGVDIESCDDVVNTNGYNVGWIGTGEWMKYTVNVTNSGVYDIHLRLAAGGSGGKLHFSSNGTDITSSVAIDSTGGWNNWGSFTIGNVILEAGEQGLVIHTDQEGFNLSSFEFIDTGADPSAVTTSYLSAKTIDEGSIEMTINKPVQSPLPSLGGAFEIQVNGSNVPITFIQIDPMNSRKMIFEIGQALNSLSVIKISYSGNPINAIDGTALAQFTLEEVENNLAFAHPIPGIIQAEDYSAQVGIQLENCTDIGGGQNIGYLDLGDYLDYEINVQDSGTYALDFRTASQSADGAIELQLIDEEGGSSLLGEYNFMATGGWQTWATFTDSIELGTGRHQLRMLITESPFNLNWFEFRSVEEEAPFIPSFQTVVAYPNPTSQDITIAFATFLSQNMNLYIYDSQGRIVYEKSLAETDIVNEQISLENYKTGLYLIMIQRKDGSKHFGRFVKVTR